MTLIELQRDFRGWIADGADDAAARLGDGARPGLDVYRNNYRASLSACLNEAFERVRLWIGDERFAATVAAHIDLTPPHAWTLDAYAHDFPASLKLLFPDDPEIAELGWLDLTLSEEFVGPDAEPVDPATLGDVDWDRASLRLSPTLAITDMRSNAAAIWSALSAEKVPPAAEMLAEPAALIVWRSGYVSCFRSIEADEAHALDLVRAGTGFGQLCAVMTERLGEEQGVVAAGQMLGQWIRDGLVVGIDF